VLAIVLIGLAVLIEIGATGFVRSTQPTEAEIRKLIIEQGSDDLKGLPEIERQAKIEERVQSVLQQQLGEAARPGLGIPYLALIDSLVLLTVGLMGLSLVLKPSTEARVQGCATLLFSILLVLLEIVLLILAITLLFTMLGMLASVFGIITYIALFAFFNKGGALATLALLMALKLGFGASMLGAQQAYIKQKGLLLLVLTSLLANFLLAFLIGLVPVFFDSVADAIGAIVISILAIIWTIFLLIGAVVGVFKALQPS